MSATQPCIPCCTTPQVTNVPGLQGNNGNNGTNGVNAFANTTADFVVPSLNSNVTVAVTSSLWAALGQVVIVGQGQTVIANPGPATFQVTAIPSATTLTLKFLQFPGDVAPGTTIGTGTGAGGAIVTPGSQGFQTPVSIANGGTGQTTAAAAAKALTTRERILGIAPAVNLNAANGTDVQVTTFPTKYLLTHVYVTNASISLTTATIGVFTAAGAGGTAMVSAATALSALTTATKFKDLTLNAGAGGPTTDTVAATTLFINLTAQQGAAATADFYFLGIDLT